MVLWYFGLYLPGNCYEKVRQETDAMREAMNEEDQFYNAPKKEVVFVYKGEENLKEANKDKYIVEMDKPRPSWWAPNLLTKPTKR